MPVVESKREKGIYGLFEIAVILKGVNGVIETILGTALLFFSNTVNGLVYALAQKEMIEDPNDFFVTHAEAFLAGVPQAEHFGGLYLLAHGIVKIVLVTGLLRNKAWAYPAALAVTSLFVLYQWVRIATYHSPLLLALTLIDMFVIWLIYHEYRRLVIKNSSTV